MPRSAKTGFHHLVDKRHRNFGLIGVREIEIMRLLMPHLQRAATITRVVGCHDQVTADFRTILQNLSIPIVLINGDLRVLFANEAATILRQLHAAFDVQAGCIVLGSSSTPRALEFAFAIFRMAVWRLMAIRSAFRWLTQSKDFVVCTFCPCERKAQIQTRGDDLHCFLRLWLCHRRVGARSSPHYLV